MSETLTAGEWLEQEGGYVRKVTGIEYTIPGCSALPYNAYPDDSHFPAAVQACVALAAVEEAKRLEARNPIIPLGNGCSVRKDGTPVSCGDGSPPLLVTCPRGIGYRAALAAHEWTEGGS